MDIFDRLATLEYQLSDIEMQVDLKREQYLAPFNGIDFKPTLLQELSELYYQKYHLISQIEMLRASKKYRIKTALRKITHRK